jgi:hypothetical protein
MISEAQHASLLARLLALEALLQKQLGISSRELRLAQQRAARKLEREHKAMEDWIRRQHH